MPLTLWAIPSLVGTLLALAAGWLAWRRRAAPGARSLLLLCVLVGWWCALQFVSLTVESFEAKLLAAKIQYIGISFAPFAWFLFALSYTGVRRWLQPWRLLLIAAPEVVTLLLAWTNEAHGLLWSETWLQQGPGYTYLGVAHGPWFRLRLVYAYGLVVAASSIAAFHFAHQPHHRRRLVAFLLAPLPVIALNIVYVAGLQPAGMIDLTPSGFALGGLILTWAVYRHDLLGLSPVPRSSILDMMPAGVVVLDWGERILDMNEAARGILPCLPGALLPAAVAQALRGGADGDGGARSLVELNDRAYEVTTAPGGGHGSRVVLLHEVTDRLQLERDLRTLSGELSRANAVLQSLANTDELTGLPNRRHFMEALEREVERTTRHGHPLALVLLDVDGFKQINDGYGHPAGDIVLQELGAILLATIRVTDLAGRLGGDEFGLLFPDTTPDGAAALVERLRERIATAGIEVENARSLQVTVSIGVAGARGPTSVEELFQRADDALYRAKEGGRNRVQIAQRN